MDHFLKKALKSDKRQYCYLDLQFEIRYSGEIWVHKWICNFWVVNSLLTTFVVMHNVWLQLV